MEAPGCQAAAASASGTAAGEVAAGLLAGGAAGEPADCVLRLKFWSSRSCIICTFYRLYLPMAWDQLSRMSVVRRCIIWLLSEYGCLLLLLGFELKSE